jgi:hypothetical protein
MLSSFRPYSGWYAETLLCTGSRAEPLLGYPFEDWKLLSREICAWTYGGVYLLILVSLCFIYREIWPYRPHSLVGALQLSVYCSWKTPVNGLTVAQKSWSDFARCPYRAIEENEAVARSTCLLKFSGSTSRSCMRVVTLFLESALHGPFSPMQKQNLRCTFAHTLPL